jgi:hypothetical protein
MAWMLSSSVSLRQQKNRNPTTPIDGLENGLKNSGCPYIPVPFGEL